MKNKAQTIFYYGSICLATTHQNGTNGISGGKLNDKHLFMKKYIYIDAIQCMGHLN